MFNLEGYYDLEQIYQTSLTTIYRGKDSADQRPVILKVLAEEYPCHKAIARLHKEYQLLTFLSHPRIIKAYDLFSSQHTWVLVLEDIGAQTLKKFLTNQQQVTITQFLTIALALTDALCYLQRNQIIHKDVKPENILIQPDSLDIKLTDFSLATRLTQELSTIQGIRELEGTLAYMSPEQTGRMNRALDYRTDFYSLGVTLYELLSGQLPFQSNDPLEMVYSHIAKTPVSIRTYRPDVPEMLEAVIMKLLAKNPEERYVSAAGLKADLTLCADRWAAQNAIPVFPLAQQDICDHLQISQKLYDRKTQLQTILNTFEQVSQGEVKCLLVSGYSGIGKTVLIQEMYKPLTRQAGYFIAGKFDQLQRNQPYSAISKAFEDLIRQLLGEPEEKLAAIRQEILTIVGTNGQVLIDVIPYLEQLIGKQLPAPVLNTVEAKTRFNLLFQNFLQIFAKAEHPLVIFLDDLQWADTPSLTIIENLLGNPALEYFLLIGAYRSNEVSEAHPLLMMRNELKQQGIAITEITLPSLCIEDVTQLVADSLQSKPTETRSLATLIMEKTAGNPFFIKEYLKALVREQILMFSYDLKAWQWDNKCLASWQVSQNVADLTAKNIQQLPSETQNILQLAACFGNHFDLQVLSVISELSPQKALTHLLPALEGGEIQPVKSDYQQIESLDPGTIDENLLRDIRFQFLHDQIQQAAYHQIAESRRQQVHLTIGRLLLNLYRQTSSDEAQLLIALNHINYGISLIKSKAERQQLAQLNLIAGQKAKAATAYGPALNYLQAGLSLLGTDSWATDHTLTFSINKEIAECEYLLSNYEIAEEHFNMILDRAANWEEKVAISIVKMTLYTNVGRHQDCIRLGLETLAFLGIKIPEKPGRCYMLWETQKAKWLFTIRRVYPFKKSMSDPKRLAITQVIDSVMTSAYLAQPLISAVLGAKLVCLYLQYGHTATSSIAYIMYAMILISIFRKTKLALAFANFGLKLEKEAISDVLVARNHFIVGIMINHWRFPVTTNISYLKESYQACLNVGNLPYAAYSLNQQAYTLLSTSRPLSECHQLAGQILTFAKAAKVAPYTTLWSLYSYIMYSLMEKVDFSTKELKRFLREAEKTENGLHKRIVYGISSMALFLTENYKEAFNVAKLSNMYEEFSRGQVIHMFLQTFYGLCLLRYYPDAKPQEKRSYWKILLKLRHELKVYARQCPINYAPNYFLIKAAMASLQKKSQIAINNYEKAITSAGKQGFLHYLAIAYEGLVLSYLELNKPLIAKAYGREAYQTYIGWGAFLKAKRLAERYPEWNLQQSSQVIQKDFTRSSITTMSYTLDYLSLLNATQAISGEIQLDKLLQKLLHILLQTSGAQRSVLLTRQKEQWVVIAEGTSDCSIITLTPSEAIEKRRDLPLRYIAYVQRTVSPLIMQDTMNDPGFIDPYIEQAKPKFVLVMPILYQGVLRHILYLENYLATYIFTPDHQQTLQLLASQAAISLENASLYYQATHDPLTGLANRNLFYQTFQHSVTQKDPAQHAIGILFLDLDYFKTINDNLGHEIGDELLLHVTTLLKYCLREQDLAVRLGGDEFVVMLENIKSKSQIKAVADRFYDYLAAPVTIGDAKIQPSSSMGISVYPQDGKDIQTLLKHADLALYRAKEKSKGKYQFYSPAFDKKKEG